MKSKTISLAALAAISVTGSASAADIAGGNGSFETVTLNAPETFTNAWYLTNVSLGGWTYTERTPEVNGAVWFMGGATYGTASNGNYQVNVISSGTSYFLSTQITGLTAGNSYTVYFDARQRSGGGGNFDVVVDTTVPSGGFNITPTSTAWAQQSLTFTAEAASHILRISNYDYDTNTATATGAGLMVDNFSVVVQGATDGIWTGADGNWSDATKWDANTIAQGIDKTATFNGLSPVIATVDSSSLIGALSFSGANHTIAAGAGSLTLDVTAPAVPTVTVASGITASIGALLSGNDGLAKTGPGTLTLTGVNSYTGGTAVNDGTLKLDLGATSGNASIGSFSAASGATLNLDNTNTTVGAYYPQNFVLSGAGTVAKTGVGSIDFWNGSNLNSFTGTMDVQQGALRVNNITTGANMPEATLNIASGATFDVRFNASLAVDKLTGSGTLDQSYDGGSGLSVTVGSNNGSSTFDGVIQNTSGQPLSLTKAGSGTLTLTGANGANTYTGTTTVSAGTLSFSSPMINDFAPVVIDNGATMNLNFVGNDTVGSLDIDGSGPLPAGTYNSSTHPTYLTGNGSLIVAGDNGTWTSTSSGDWSDTANWQSGTVATGTDKTATFNAATGVTVTLDTIRTIGNLAFDVSDYTIAGTNTLTLDTESSTPAISVTSGRSATLSTNLGGNEGMEKTGAGTLVLSGVKTYTGGTLELAGGNSGNSIIRGALNISPGATVTLTGGDGSGFGWNDPVTSINIDAGTINATGSSHLGFGGPAATLALDNGSSVQGAWQWNGDGGLSFSSYGDSTNTISGSLTLRADEGVSHTFFVDNGASATDLQINANLSDQWPEYAGVPASGLTKSGEGTMVLNGTNTYDGNTLVAEGVLSVTASSSLHFRPTLNGATNSVSGSGSSALTFLGTVDLDLSAAVAAGGNVWNLFNLASFTTAPDLSATAAVTSTLGAFTESPAGTWKLPVSGAEWVFTEADGNLAYVVTATPYATWGSTYGLTAGSEGGDLDNDGLTNFEEFAFGLIPNSGSSVNPITSQLNKTTGQFTYQRLNGSGLTYTIWTSTDLVTWDEDETASANQNVSTGTPNDSVQVTLTGAPLTASKLFVRVEAE